MFAGERLDSEEDPGERSAAIRSLLDWCLRAADKANRMLTPHRRALPYRTDDEGAQLPLLHGYDGALAWCEAEQATMLGALGLAVEHGHDDVAWQLPLALTPYLETRRAWRTLLEMTLAGRDATRRLGDVGAEAWTNNGLGIAYTSLGDMAAARDCFTAALAIRESIGDEAGISAVLNNLGELSRLVGVATTPVLTGGHVGPSRTGSTPFEQ